MPDHVYLPAFQSLFQRSRTSAEAPDTQDLINLILDMEPLFAPGKGWAYSDTGYLLAAQVSEDRPGVTYGLGVVIEPTEQYGEVRGHRGWIPGYVSSLRYYPDYDIAIAIQINSDIGMMGQEGSFIGVEAEIAAAILNRYLNGE